MSDLLILEAANLFIGDEDPEKSKHLAIENLTLPTIEQTTVEHMPGGGSMGIEVGMGIIKPLQPQFKLVGFDPEAYAAAGVGSNTPKIFTARGLIRRKSDGKAFGCVAVIRGIMSKVAPDQFQRSQMFGHDHAISEVSRYKLSINDTVWYDIDFFASKRVRFGVDELAETRSFLGLA